MPARRSPELADLPPLPEQRTLQEHLADYLRQAILRGSLKPGDQIRPEVVARHFGVSRMPVREALRQLAFERFVVVLPNRGVFVTALSADEVEELYIERAAFESFAARLAAPHLGPSEVAALREQLQAMEAAAAAGDLVQFVAADRAFHRVIYERCGRPSVVERIFRLWDSSVRVARMALALPGATELALAAHRRVLAAVESGEPRRLEAAVFDHTDDWAERVVEHLRAQEQAPAPSDSRQARGA